MWICLASALQKCDQISELIYTTYSGMQINVKRTDLKECERIYQPQYGYVLAGGRPALRFLVSDKSVSQLRDGTNGYMADAECNPDHKDVCRRVLSQLLNNQTVQLTVQILNDTSDLQTGSARHYQLLGIDVLQNETELTFTVRSPVETHGQMSYVCDTSESQKTSTAETKQAAATPREVGLREGTTNVTFTCSECANRLVHRCRVFIDGVTYIPDTINVTPAVLKNESTVIYTSIIVVCLIVLAVIVTLAVLKCRKRSQYKKPVKIDRRSVERYSFRNSLGSRGSSASNQVAGGKTFSFSFRESFESDLRKVIDLD